MSVAVNFLSAAKCTYYTELKPLISSKKLIFYCIIVHAVNNVKFVLQICFFIRLYLSNTVKVPLSALM